jgi:hypothetical protein
MIAFETPFIEQYCLVPNEQLLMAFNGEFSDYNYVYVGRVYVTNLRMIVLGHPMRRAPGPVLGGNLLATLIVRGIIIGSRLARSRFVRAQLKDFSSGFNDVLDYVLSVSRQL